MTTLFETSSNGIRIGDPSGERCQRGHVLIIDDEPSIIEVLTEILSDEGWRVTGMRTPPSLADIHASSPNLILLDRLFNGQQDGLPLLDAIRSNPSTATIPIIVCTALSHPEHLMEPTEYHPDITILTKPFELDDVIATVEAVARPSIPPSNQDRWADRGPVRESAPVVNS